MAKLKLVKGRSYMYKGYKFNNSGILDVKEEDAAYLLDTGAFERLDVKVESAPEPKKAEPKTKRAAKE